MRITSLFFLVALSGCALVPSSTVNQLESIDPLRADPGDFAVAVSLPEGLEVAPGSARLVVMAERDKPAEAVVAEGVLQPQSAQATVLPGAPDAKGIIYRIAPGDLEELRAAQAKLIRWKAEDEKGGNGSISVMATPCAHGAAQIKGAKASIWLQVTPGGDFLPIVQDGPLSAVFGSEAPQPCPN